ncbi:uncharacterized protein BDZ83DRAFT_624912 [Colletotrichum acutatum]|uniref:Uncharacterized protein n=1 Tax=Glomerella acutata TaxID=27357 RepID=A0AAD8XGF0_GLOAC|nr:uncharacterized protein BDZ83DRAFT_624912 [Colletotrichum acutatum]KAK1723853.1 hypothetical protein BDZ83DRAFT_624912 [Colletotrichum acutatum]
MLTVGIVDTFPSNGVARIVHNCAKESTEYPTLKMLDAELEENGFWQTLRVLGLGSLSSYQKVKKRRREIPFTRIRMPTYVPSTFDVLHLQLASALQKVKPSLVVLTDAVTVAKRKEPARPGRAGSWEGRACVLADGKWAQSNYGDTEPSWIPHCKKVLQDRPDCETQAGENGDPWAEDRKKGWQIDRVRVLAHSPRDREFARVIRV